MMIGNPSNTTQQAGKSAIPFLVGGSVAIVAVVAVALLLLVCAFKILSGHHVESSTGRNYNNTAAAVECGESREDTEAKVMVIMAGDKRPNFFAKPAMFGAGDMENGV